jgi:DNA-binding NtrC family response regulator
MVDFNKAGQPVTLTLEREFRGAGVYPKMDISIDMGDFGDSTYNVKLDKHVAHKSDSTGGRHKKPSNPDLKQEIVDFILLKQGASARQIAEELGISKRKVNELLKEIHEDRQKPVPEVKPD